MCFDGRAESDCEAVNDPSSTDTALRVKVYHSYGVGENPDVVDVRVYVNFAKRGTIESPETPADRYTYEFKITRVSPSHGARDGGNVVNVYGVGLKQVDGVCFDGPGGGQCPSPESGSTDTYLKVKAPRLPNKNDVPYRVNLRALLKLDGSRIQSPVTAADRYTYK